MFSTTIKRIYWDMKMQDAKAHRGRFFEYKSTTSFWMKRLKEGDLMDAVFLVGREVHRARVLSVMVISLDEVPEKYRGPLTTKKVFELMCHTDECEEDDDAH